MFPNASREEVDLLWRCPHTHELRPFGYGIQGIKGSFGTRTAPLSRSSGRLEWLVPVAGVAVGGSGFSLSEP